MSDNSIIDEPYLSASAGFTYAVLYPYICVFLFCFGFFCESLIFLET